MLLLLHQTGSTWKLFLGEKMDLGTMVKNFPLPVFEGEVL